MLSLPYLFGVRGSALTSDVVLGGGANPGWSAVSSQTDYLVAVLRQPDVDANTQFEAMTDGLKILRSLLGLTGNAVTQKSTGAGFTRMAADIPAYIQTVKHD